MDQAIELSTRAAAAVMLLLGPDQIDKYEWPLMGAELTVPPDAGDTPFDFDDELARRTAVLAQFARAYPDAPLEAMYRHAAGQGIHSRPADGFDEIEPAFRIAYEVFRSTLLTADRVFADEEARAAAKALAEAVQAPVIVPVEDTILARGNSIMDRIGDAPEMVNLGGPLVAASTEGEGGDDDSLEGSGSGSDDAETQPAAAAVAAQNIHGAAAAPTDAPVSGGGDAGELVSAEAVEPNDAGAVADGGLGATPQIGGDDVGEADAGTSAPDAGAASSSAAAHDAAGEAPPPVKPRRK